jgi:hypothetical protein
MGIGLLMFLINTYILQEDSNKNEGEYEVYLNAGEVKSMQEVWTSKWQRPPTEVEMQGMLNQRVEETILFREAVKIGLDKNDDIIRQRMAQKLEFLSNDLARPDSATAEEVKEYFERNIENYTTPRSITITQLFVDPKKYGNSLEEEIKTRLTKLNGMNAASSGISRYGDQFLLQAYFPNKSELELGKLFGSEFANNIFELEADKWVGPVNSQYGPHLVYIANKTQAIIPDLETVKELVTEDLQREKQEKLNALYIDGILSRYKVIIEDEDEV